MSQLKDRLLAVGVLLLGAAALGRVALSWVQHVADSKLRQRQEQLRQDEVVNREDIIKNCHSQATQAIPAYLDALNKKGVKYVDDWDYDKQYEGFYRDCLREHGLER